MTNQKRKSVSFSCIALASAGVLAWPFQIGISPKVELTVYVVAVFNS